MYMYMYIHVHTCKYMRISYYTWQRCQGLENESLKGGSFDQSDHGMLLFSVGVRGDDMYMYTYMSVCSELIIKYMK